MNIPQELTQAIAISLASPSDTHAMRVIVRNVANQNHFRWSGKRRSYLMNFCPVTRTHFIDVPLSVWQDGIYHDAPYLDNQSVAHDIQVTRPGFESLVCFLVPFANPKAAPIPDVPPAPAVLSSLRSLAERFGAPPVILEAFDFAARGLPDATTCLALDNTVPAGDPAPDLDPTPEPDAHEITAMVNDRAAKMRQAKAEKAAARMAGSAGIDPLM